DGGQSQQGHEVVAGSAGVAFPTPEAPDFAGHLIDRQGPAQVAEGGQDGLADQFEHGGRGCHRGGRWTAQRATLTPYTTSYQPSTVRRAHSTGTRYVSAPIASPFFAVL